MSRVRSLEKELRHLAQLKQRQEELLLGGKGQAPQSLGRMPAAAGPTASPAANRRSSSSSSSLSPSPATNGGHEVDGEGSEGRRPSSNSSTNSEGACDRAAASLLKHNANSANSLLFSSPNSTGSRFDLLMEGGRQCTRGEVRRATHTTRQKGKPTAAEGVANRSRDDGSGSGDGGGSSVNALRCGKESGSCPAALPPPLKPDPSVTPITIPSQAPFRRLQRQPFSHILVCDFEATCESGSVNYPHEIIEFPVVVLDTVSLQAVAEFHSYVRPVRNPKLTKFCTELTGITQEMVDRAEPLPVVVDRFRAWLRDVLYPLCRTWRSHYTGGVGDAGDATAVTTGRQDSGGATIPGGRHGVEYCSFLSHNLRSEQKRFTYDDKDETSRATMREEAMVCFATDGPWDMRRFMHECGVLRDAIDFPPVCYRYINVRHSFCDYFKSRQIKLTHMLKKLHMSFEGQRHSGIADTRNIARVLAELFARGYRVHHVSTIKYVHRGDAFLASNAAAQELLAEYGEDDKDGRTRRGQNRNARRNLPRNKQQPRGKRGNGVK